MSKVHQVNVNKTITIASDVFMAVMKQIEDTDGTFNEAINDLCRDGLKAREAQEPQAAGGAEDVGE